MGTFGHFRAACIGHQSRWDAATATAGTHVRGASSLTDQHGHPASLIKCSSQELKSFWIPRHPTTKMLPETETEREWQLTMRELRSSNLVILCVVKAKCGGLGRANEARCIFDLNLMRCAASADQAANCPWHELS